MAERKRATARDFTVCQCIAVVVVQTDDGDDDVRCRCLEKQLRTYSICGACKRGSHVLPGGVRS